MFLSSFVERLRLLICKLIFLNDEIVSNFMFSRVYSRSQIEMGDL